MDLVSTVCQGCQGPFNKADFIALFRTLYNVEKLKQSCELGPAPRLPKVISLMRTWESF